MNAGDTFLAPGIDDHLWMVISDPAIDPGRLVIVCFLSWQSHHDQACVVNAGEHPFVHHATTVNYPGAMLVSDPRLESLKTSGKLKNKDPLSPELLDRIRRNVRDSEMPTESYEVMREQALI